MIYWSNSRKVWCFQFLHTCRHLYCCHQTDRQSPWTYCCIYCYIHQRMWGRQATKRSREKVTKLCVSQYCGFSSAFLSNLYTYPCVLIFLYTPIPSIPLYSWSRFPARTRYSPPLPKDSEISHVDSANSQRERY